MYEYEVSVIYIYEAEEKNKCFCFVSVCVFEDVLPTVTSDSAVSPVDPAVRSVCNYTLRCVCSCIKPLYWVYECAQVFCVSSVFLPQTEWALVFLAIADQ